MAQDELDLDALREEVIRLGPWHHDVELTAGLRTAEAPLTAERARRWTPTIYRPDRQMERLARDLFGGGFEGRSFLDCACNGGGHALAAARLGAGRCFGFDARAQWIDQARFLARFAPHRDMTFETMALDELAERDPGPFDVTLFGGIFYHLPDPVRGLKIAADRTREILIVNTGVRPRLGRVLTLSKESVTAAMSGVHGLAWLPSGPAVLEDILAWCGFPATRLHWQVRTGLRAGRLQLLAARDERAFAHFDRARPDISGTPTQRLAGSAGRLLYRLGVRFT